MQTLRKFRKESPKEKARRWLHRGLTGLGVMVLVLSVTQGLTGLLGVLLLMALISAFYGSLLSIYGWVNGFINRRAE
jgi:hypothetical protein